MGGMKGMAAPAIISTTPRSEPIVSDRTRLPPAGRLADLRPHDRARSLTCALVAKKSPTGRAGRGIGRAMSTPLFVTAGRDRVFRPRGGERLARLAEAEGRL